jgi:hypothetical protein
MPPLFNNWNNKMYISESLSQWIETELVEME